MTILSATALAKIPIGNLVRADRVHGTDYYDPAVFESELKKICMAAVPAVGGWC
jgi:hypothetical protein